MKVNKLHSVHALDMFKTNSENEPMRGKFLHPSCKIDSIPNG